MKLHFRKYGEGQPFLILHGLFGSSDNWLTLGKKFSAKYQVYIIDQRNHARSPHSNSISYDLMADDLYELILDEGLNEIILLGHSMGGKTAMRFVQKYPHLIHKLIIADIGRKQYPAHHEYIIQGLNAIDLTKIKSRREARLILSKYVKEEGLKQFLLKNLFWINKGQLSWRMNLPVLEKKMNEILSEIQSDIVLTPTLFLKGERSDYILESDFEDLNYYFPNADIETIYNAGHWLHAENPFEFHELVMEFLNN